MFNLKIFLRRRNISMGWLVLILVVFHLSTLIPEVQSAVAMSGNPHSHRHASPSREREDDGNLFLYNYNIQFNLI